MLGEGYATRESTREGVVRGASARGTNKPTSKLRVMRGSGEGWKEERPKDRSKNGVDNLRKEWFIEDNISEVEKNEEDEWKVSEVK